MNGVSALSSPGNPYFDLGPVPGPHRQSSQHTGGLFPDSTGSQQSQNTGQVDFTDISITVPEPSSLALLGTGILTLLLRFLRGRRI